MTHVIPITGASSGLLRRIGLEDLLTPQVSSRA